MRSRLFISLAAFMWLGGPAQAGTEAGSAGEAPELRARQLVSALGDESPARLKSYLAKWGSDALRSDRFFRIAQRARFQMGDRPTIVEVRDAAPGTITAIVRNPVTERWHPITVDVERQPPYRLREVRFGPFTTPPAKYRPHIPSRETDRLALLDRFASRLADLDRFSGVVLIAKHNRVIFEKAYGLADRTFGVRNTVATRFNVGSIDKLFTSIAVARLVEQGRLSFEDPLSKFLPFPDQETAQKIKLKHLLSHTSGLGDYVNEEFLDRRTTFYSLDDYAGHLETLKPVKLAFEPGTGWNYSNMGMLLAGRIVERASGTDYFQYIRTAVFAPAGMSDTIDLELEVLNPRVATPYDIKWMSDRIGYWNAGYYLPARSAPDGGSVATARDLAKLASALREGALINSQTFALMAAPKNELGAGGRYGFGLSDMNRRLGSTARKVIGHGGDADGVCATFAMIEDTPEPYTLVVLSNSFGRSCFPVGEFALEMIPPRSSTGVANH